MDIIKAIMEPRVVLWPESGVRPAPAAVAAADLRARRGWRSSASSAAVTCENFTHTTQA
jgi:hypothetical protein